MSGAEFVFHPFSPIDIRILDRDEAVGTLSKLYTNGPDTWLVASPRTIGRLGLGDIFGKNCRLLSAFSSNPTVDELLDCYKRLGGAEVRRLICIGGGSAIDVGKALCAMLSSGFSAAAGYDGLLALIKGKVYLSYCNRVELIAVPTTAGTGSDVTHWATIWDKRGGIKLSVDKEDLCARLSLIVPEFTAGMPRALTLSTGLDAMAQAVEAFWSKRRNPLSQALALQAVGCIRENLPLVLEAPEDIGLRRAMCVGALLSGLAFSQTRTTACHSISYPMTLRFGVAHGFAVAVTLASVAEINRQAVPEIEKIYDIFGGRQAFVQWLEAVSRPIQPLRLSAMGIGEADIPALAAGAFTQGRMDNNPVALDTAAVESILRENL